MGVLEVNVGDEVTPDWHKVGCGGTAGGPDTETFTYTGSADTFVVPAGVTTLTVEAWGGEGGPSSGTPVGGLGGYIKADIAVTPGETLDLGVGGGGTTNGFGAFGGGAPSSAVDGAGDGGGLSHVSRSGTFLVVAGAG